MTLANGPYAQPRAPVSSDFLVSGSVAQTQTETWTGYGTSDYNHHLLNPGANARSLDAVLRFMDQNGNWQVYTTLGENEQEPNGRIDNSAYNIYGIGLPTTTATTTVNSGVFAWMFDTNDFADVVDTNTFAELTGPNPQWAKPGQPTFYGGFYDTYWIPVSVGMNRYIVQKPDPRTARFGIAGDYASWSMNPLVMNITLPILNPTDSQASGEKSDVVIPGWSEHPAPALAILIARRQIMTVLLLALDGNDGVWWPAMWSVNSPNVLSQPGNSQGTLGTYYYDKGPSGMRSGKIRPGDNYFTYFSGLSNTQGVTGTNNTYQPSPGVTSPAQPVILHRPFRSVGELGYAFRDMPYKTLDMASNLSVDAALLDYFTVDPSVSKVVAGRVSANTRQVPVLQAIMSSEFRAESLATGSFNGPMAPSAAATIAQSLVTMTATNPLMSRADLVTRFASVASGSSTIFNAATTGASTSTYPSIKIQREAPVRALADSTQARTWTLLIDVIAQSGRYLPGATDLTKGFVVDGERRYWLHVAIDRFTGQIIDQQLEPVYE